MKEIDFVPQWYRSSQRRRNDLAVRVACLCMLVAAMVAWSIRNLAVVQMAEADTAALQESYRSQGALQDQHAALQRRLQQLEGRRALLRALRGGVRAEQVLAELSHLMPEAMALTNVTLRQHDRLEFKNSQGGAQRDRGSLRGLMEVEGLAASHGHVGSFLAALERSPCFRGLEMKYSKPVVREGRQARDFRVVMRIPRFE